MKKIIPYLFAIALTSPVFAQSYYTENGTAQFTSSVPLHNFTGTSESLVGMIKLDEMSVDFYIDLETLDTGNAKRDKDMLITLETEKYPFGEFFGKITSEFDPSSSDEQAVTVEGNFTIHGQTNQVEIDGTITVTDEGLLVKASWILNLDDYGIVPPKLLLIKVDEEQAIEIEALLQAMEGE